MRKLATAAAVSLVLASSGARALGLGDIEMRSALNQPMEAEIRLTSVKPGETEGMIVQLASPAAFARAGIERSPALTGLQFSVESGANGPVIRITSRQPVLEPFLNFLVEVDWPQGRMVREYTVLLDPPVFMTPNASTRNSSSDTPVQTQSDDNALIAPAPIERDQAGNAAAEELAVGPSNNTAGTPDAAADDGDSVSLDSLAPADSAGQSGGAEQTQSNAAALADNTPGGNAVPGVDTGEVDIGDQEELVIGDTLPGRPSADAEDSEVVSLDAEQDVTVSRGDTLFQIANRTRGQGVSVQQMMLALLEANENAFIRGNVNLVKAGAILRVPGSSTQTSLSQAAALAEIGKQNDLWREYRDNLRNGAATRLAQADTAEPATTGAGGNDAGASQAESGAEAEAGSDSLSADAQAILDDARSEVRNRRDLSIVADNASTAGAASATADESQTDDDSGQLAQINQQLQIAREELSSTRLQSQDLDEQSSVLQNTNENLDNLMNLRQNEVAELEAQLVEAREAEAAAEAAAAREAEQKAEAEAQAEAQAAAEAADEEAAEANAQAAREAEAAASDATAAEGADEQSTAIGDGAQADNSANALTEAGEPVGEVELVDSESGNDQSAAAGDETTAGSAAGSSGAADDSPQAAWYQGLLSDPNKLAIAGVGALGVLGLLALLLRRRRKGADDESAFPDEVQYIDDNEAESLQQELDEEAVVKTGEKTGEKTAEPMPVAEAGVVPEPVTPVVAAGAASGKADDILSEADVYLAYGLHGQAEELLKSAVASNTENPDYALKLLQTYHAQGKADAFSSNAQAFHARFGGAANPAWASVAALGHELDPGNTLYADASGELNGSSGITDHQDNPQLDDGAFDLPDDNGTGSVNRHFGDEDTPDLSEDDLYSASAEGRAESETEAQVEFDAGSEAGSEIRPGDEIELEADDATEAPGYSPVGDDDFSDELDTDLLDQSLDPALAFDESDLEATGDFSSLTDELATENEGSIDFTDFDSSTTNGAAPVTADPASLSGINGLDMDAESTTTGMADTAAIENELTFEELSLADMDSEEADADLDSLDLSSPVSEELALDLEELSDDIGSGNDNLAGSEFDDLELPELNSEPSSLLSEGASLDADEEADDMDTMMDLARAYIDMGDKSSASNTLDEIVKSGSPSQVSEAETLLRKIS